MSSNISAMVEGFLTNHNECHNGAIAASGMDKSLGQTHATELAMIHIPKGTLMVEGGHAYAYETVMRCSQPYSMVTAAHSCTGHGSCSRREQIQISGESTGGSPSTQPHEHECRRGQACATASAIRGKPANPAAS